MSQNQVITLPNKTQTPPTVCEYSGGFFKLSEEGLFFIGHDKDGNQLPPRWLCSPLHVVAKTRDAKSGEWGRLLEWKDDDAVTHQWAMPSALLQGDASEVRRELARCGLALSPNKQAQDLVTSYLQVFPVEARARCVDKLGWYGDIFVTANKCIGNTEEKVVFQNMNAIEPALHSSGTVEEWRNTIGQLAAGNSRLVFAIATAFAPSLAKLVGEDSGGFHLRGASSCGKSTALKVAASVWGNPQDYCRLWRSTSNGLEGLAALHNDGLLILDEISQIDPREAGEAAYLLANGQGKTRASRTGTVKQSSRWSLLFLSAGEESLTLLMARAGQRTNAGQEIRLADIEADAGMGKGLFETIHNLISPAAMALRLKELSSQFYGSVGMSWLQNIVSQRQSIIPILSNMTKQFVDMVISQEATGQSTRVARRFALVAAAGELATQFGLTGWQKGESFYATKKCFESWQDTFGTEGNREDRAILAQVRAFFETFGTSRFDNVKEANNERILNRAGFYKVDDEGFRRFMVLPEVYKNELCKGFESRVVTRVLLNAGWIVPASDGKASHKPRIKGVGTPRVYVFTDKIWGDE